jgi:C1A family cysteine protease
LINSKDKFLSFNYTPTNTSHDLTTNYKFPPIYNQSTLGSCSANAICAAYCFDSLNNECNFCPSRLYLYYKERKMENDIAEDKGAIISDGLNVIHSLGVCSEEKWPYDVSKFADQPPEICDVEAKNHKSIDQRRVACKLNDLKNCIDNKLPFIFGFDVFESFENIDKNNFIMTLPKENEKQLGGHAVLCVGYDDENQLFKIRNSWGEEWGDKGHFYMPYDYITNASLCADFWVISSVKNIESVIFRKQTWAEKFKNDLEKSKIIPTSNTYDVLSSSIFSSTSL